MLLSLNIHSNTGVEYNVFVLIGCNKSKNNQYTVITQVCL